MSRLMIPKFGSDNPRAGLYEKEFQVAFVKVCSLICILKNKKLNMPNIFIEILKNDNIRCIYKHLCDFDNDYEAISKIIEIEPSVIKSKYIKKFLNNKQTVITINDKPRKTHL